ncbi:hypothetical protein [Sphingobium abikonense]|uniref:hypothetical protein n=1 Tax=Sphingobium abikonense TaxID=86193 RepID=UPI001FDF5A46|nr:hypothetical protein [Sphingobium abikonense]
MKIIESLDEALYTVMGWLVFYPMTLWRALVHPLAMMAYADREVSDTPEDQYDDAIRPPLFLFLSLLISHGLETLIAGRNALLTSNRGLEALVDTDLALLALRLVLFSLFALLMSVFMLRRQGLKLTHSNLRRPFYGQCFTTAPLALMAGIATLLPILDVSHGRMAGALLGFFTAGWYLAVQALWFSTRLGIGRLAGFRQAAAAIMVAILLFTAVAVVIGLSAR